MKFIFFFLMLLTGCAEAKDKLYVCAIFNNEARFLDHWIEFHIQQGADKIYLYNNNSTDDYPKVLYKYIRGGVVVLKQWSYTYESPDQWNRIQCDAYLDCAKRVKNKAEWVAFLDTDEFLFSPLHKRVRDVLDYYEDVDAIGVNWVMYGTSYVEYLIDGRLCDNMIYRAPLEYEANIHVKTIARPNKISDCDNPHYFHLISDARMVNENKETMNGPFSKHSSHMLRINHYWLRDLTFLHEVKAPRRAGWFGEPEYALKEADKTLNQIHDPILKNWNLD